MTGRKAVSNLDNQRIRSISDNFEKKRKSHFLCGHFSLGTSYNSYSNLYWDVYGSVTMVNLVGISDLKLMPSLPGSTQLVAIGSLLTINKSKPFCTRVP